MTYFLSPIGNDQQVDINGRPLSGGTITTYLADSSTPAATYTTNLGTIPQSNPITLNALGLPASPIWMEGGIALKFVIKNSAGVEQRTVDNVVGLNDPGESFTEWVVSGLTPTYVNATTFTVPGDQTDVLQVNRRIEYRLNSGTFYGYIFSSSFGIGVTTVVIAPDDTNLDSSLSSFKYGFISAAPTSIPQQFVIAAEDKVPARANPITALKVLSNDGTTPAWYTLRKVIQTFTASGTYTPTAGMVFCDVEMVGGGAGGAQVSTGNYGGAGGSAGEYARGTFSAADIGASKAVTRGSGGAANNAGTATSLGTLLTANGAAASTTGIPGAGGTGGTGLGLHVPGGQGQSGAPTSTAPLAVGGSGGASFFGSGGRGGQGGLDNGQDGGPYGSGGGGNGYSGSWGSAGAGKPGVVIVTEYVLEEV